MSHMEEEDGKQAKKKKSLRLSFAALCIHGR